MSPDSRQFGTNFTISFRILKGIGGVPLQMLLKTQTEIFLIPDSLEYALHMIDFHISFSITMSRYFMPSPIRFPKAQMLFSMIERLFSFSIKL